MPRPSGSLTARLPFTPASPPPQIDYTKLLVYNVPDSMLSHPSERNSIIILGSQRVSKDRQRRRNEHQERLLKSVASLEKGKGKVDRDRVERAQRVTPAFLGLCDLEDTSWGWGSTGYPLTKNGIVASGSVMNASVVEWGVSDVLGYHRGGSSSV